MHSKYICIYIYTCRNIIRVLNRCIIMMINANEQHTNDGGCKAQYQMAFETFTSESAVRTWHNIRRGSNSRNTLIRNIYASLEDIRKPRINKFKHLSIHVHRYLHMHIYIDTPIHEYRCIHVSVCIVVNSYVYTRWMRSICIYIHYRCVCVCVPKRMSKSCICTTPWTRFMHIYVCLYKHMYVYVDMHISATSVYICIRPHIHTSISLHVYTCTRAQTYERILR